MIRDERCAPDGSALLRPFGRRKRRIVDWNQGVRTPIVDFSVGLTTERDGRVQARSPPDDVERISEGREKSRFSELSFQLLPLKHCSI